LAPTTQIRRLVSGKMDLPRAAKTETALSLNSFRERGGKGLGMEQRKKTWGRNVTEKQTRIVTAPMSPRRDQKYHKARKRRGEGGA